MCTRTRPTPGALVAIALLTGATMLVFGAWALAAPPVVRRLHRLPSLQPAPAARPRRVPDRHRRHRAAGAALGRRADRGAGRLGGRRGLHAVVPPPRPAAWRSRDRPVGAGSAGRAGRGGARGALAAPSPVPRAGRGGTMRVLRGRDD